jgi:hypothetical protein
LLQLLLTLLQNVCAAADIYDCCIKGDESDGDDNSTYCKNCYDENIWYDRQYETLLMNQAVKNRMKTKKQIQK